MTTLQAGKIGNNKPKKTFYLSVGASTGSDFIYDETYKNYKNKQKFEKDPKYSYFNAIMHMKRKLSAKQQLYNKVFTPKGNESPKPQQKTFYNSRACSSSFREPQTEYVRIQQLKRNSFRIVKEQARVDNIPGLRKQYSHNDMAGDKANLSSVINYTNKQSATQLRSGHKSNMSLYDRPFNQPSFQMTSKSRNNKSYIQLEFNNNPTQPHSQKASFQPFNPRPRLDQIMSEYRKMNRHSHNFKIKRSSLPKQMVEKLYQTNKMFYMNGKKRISIG